MDDLPRFKYHPDPVQSGVVKKSGAVCVSCSRARGWIYTGPVYAKDELDRRLCPWCIADGSAAQRFDASFGDVEGLAGQVAADVLDEVLHRTPGYVTWQGERWKSHCGDACECHGDLPRRDLEQLDQAAQAHLRTELQLEAESWARFVKSYRPGGQPAIYLFVCRHCGERQYDVDYT